MSKKRPTIFEVLRKHPEKYLSAVEIARMMKIAPISVRKQMNRIAYYLEYEDKERRVWGQLPDKVRLQRRFWDSLCE